MAKDPAFLFYPNDWLGGTMGMSFEEKGAYLELLLMQFNRGHMTEHMIRHTIGHSWDKLKDKFSVDDAGLFYNKRLKFEHEKRRNYSESRKNNKNGANQHTPKEGHMTSRKSSHMENGNINGNESKNRTENSLDGGLGEEKFIVPRMCKVWYESFPTYTSDKENDFDGMGKVLQFVIRQANVKNIQDADVQSKVLNTLQLIADQVNREPFWVNKPIRSIANNIQEFYNKIKNPIDGKQSGNNGQQTDLRAAVQAEVNKRFANRKQAGT